VGWYAQSAVLAAALIAATAAGCGVDSPVSRELGARCDMKDDCDERCLFPSREFPGGFCTLSCATSADCARGASCAGVEGGVCLFNCLSESHCDFLGAGWRCESMEGRDGSEVMVCIGED
jgi:hypothetical protein